MLHQYITSHHVNIGNKLGKSFVVSHPSVWPYHFLTHHPHNPFPFCHLNQNLCTFSFHSQSPIQYDGGTERAEDTCGRRGPRLRHPLHRRPQGPRRRLTGLPTLVRTRLPHSEARHHRALLHHHAGAPPPPLPAP